MFSSSGYTEKRKEKNLNNNNNDSSQSKEMETRLRQEFNQKLDELRKEFHQKLKTQEQPTTEKKPSSSSESPTLRHYPVGIYSYF